MVRPIVSHKHGAALEVDGMKFRKTAADVETVEDHHRDAVFEIKFAAHRKARRRKERIADDEIGDQFARQGTGFPFVVIGKAVQVALGDEFLERDGGLRRHVKIVIGELFGPGVGNRVGRVEEG